jgi:hypothetical protein
MLLVQVIRSDTPMCMCVFVCFYIIAIRLSCTFPISISNIHPHACIQVDDTLGILKSSDEIYKFSSNHKRGFPLNWTSYLKSNFPISQGSFDLIGKAEHKFDWLTNLAMHTCPALFAMILVQYCFAVFKWSAPQASVAVFSIGGCLGLFAPCLLTRYNPIPLAFYAMCLFTFGLFVLSAAGAGLDLALSSKLGILGIGCIAMGTSWIPALQSNLTNQYGPDIQGLVSGLLSQEKDFAMLPGYLISLGFTFSLRRNGPIYWPGCSMFMAGCMGVAAICLHVNNYGSEATKLTLRKPKQQQQDTTTVVTPGEEGKTAELTERAKGIKI